MAEQPPGHLIALLERLGLASGGELRRMSHRVGRLARELPRFESVWIDALAQARILTPFQAAQINAGRAESLRVGPYLLRNRTSGPGYVACYRARGVHRGRIVRLAVADKVGGQAQPIIGALEKLAATAGRLRCQWLATIDEAGVSGDRVWAASPWVEGRTAAEWMVHNGRFPPGAVIEIARAMVGGLVALERAGLCHGDVSTATVLLTGSGTVVLTEPGLRAILRPEEGFAQGDLQPQAYDYLAPERIAEGSGPTVAGDVYACGCVWWHMLCGRPPLGGGDALGKLRAAGAAKLQDVRQLALDVPEELGAAVCACVQREPGRRPASMADLAAMLEGRQQRSQRALSKSLAAGVRTPGRWAMPLPAARGRGRLRLGLAAAAACLVAAAAIVWPLRQGRLPWQGARRVSGIQAPGNAGGDGSLSGQGQTDPDLGGQRLPSAWDGDIEVVAADYQESIEAMQRAGVGVEERVIESLRPAGVESLRLRAGEHVQGGPGERPSLMVPPTGLPVDVEGVCFEGVDFVWDHPARADGAGQGQAAIVDLRCGGTEFRRCTFRSIAGLPTCPVAIRWTHPADGTDSALSLPNGRVQLSDCVLQRVDAGVDCRTVGAVAVEVVNTLQLGGGPLVRLDHWPSADEPVAITLGQVTLRDGGGVLECRSALAESRPGMVSIRAAGCAFVPRAGEALLAFCGGESPEGFLGRIRWTGQGSLVLPGTEIAVWRPGDGRQEVLDEAGVSIEGLVRSEVGFAGEALGGPSASRVVRWQAPLQSTDPPGIDVERIVGRD